MTALKKEWKGKVGVKVVRTDGYRSSIPLLQKFNHHTFARQGREYCCGADEERGKKLKDDERMRFAKRW